MKRAKCTVNKEIYHKGKSQGTTTNTEGNAHIEKIFKNKSYFELLRIEIPELFCSAWT